MDKLVKLREVNYDVVSTNVFNFLLESFVVYLRECGLERLNMTNVQDTVAVYTKRILLVVKDYPLAIKVSRDKKAYTGSDYISYSMSIKFQDFLVDKGVSYLKLGEFDKKRKKADKSTITLGSNFAFKIKKIAGDYYFKNKDLSVILKVNNKKVKLSINSITKAMIKDMDIINGYLNDVLATYDTKGLNNIADYETFSQKYFRIFSEDITKCGRLYCSKIQGLNQSVRLKILLNGHSVTELDFKAMQSSTIADLVGHKFEEDFDPYLPNTELYNSFGVHQRDIGKAIMTRVLNCKSDNTARLSVDKLIRYGDNLPKEAHKKLIKKSESMQNLAYLLVVGMLDHNSYIKDVPYKRPFYALTQKIDSDIIVKSALEFVRLDIPFALVHDSVLVPTIHEKTVENILRKCYNDVIGSSYNCRISKETLNNEPYFIEDVKDYKTYLNKYIDSTMTGDKF